jgi:hypothetical protein
MPKAAVSDTVHVTTDGRTIVDVRKLFGKKHMQDAIRAMRAKTRIVPRRRATVPQMTSKPDLRTD